MYIDVSSLNSLRECFLSMVKPKSWNNDLFMVQIDKAFKIAEAKPTSHLQACLDILPLVWAHSHDALVVLRLGRKPGSKQPAMKDTTWPQKMVG